MKKSIGVTRDDGLSVSVYTRIAPEAVKASDVLVVEVTIPFDTLTEFLPTTTGGQRHERNPAVRHGLNQGALALGVPIVRFWLTSDRRTVLVLVWDASDQMPVRQQPEPDAVSGRGILLVEQLSAGWGVNVPAGGNGTVVWAAAAVP